MPLPDDALMMKPGCARVVREGDDAAILAFGRMVSYARVAADLLAEEGLSVRVVDMRWVKPLDEEAIRAASETRAILTVEDGVRIGGAGEGVVEVLSRQRSDTPIATLGLPDAFVAQGKVDQLFAELGLDAPAIAAALRALL